MRKRALPRTFFDKPTVFVACALLGKFLVRRLGKKELRAEITEVEVYDGPSDRGSHARRGITKRNKPMFGASGHWYIYFTYGMHWMLNVVTGPKGYPAAVLIRGTRDVRGPARVTKYLKINGKLSGCSVSKKSGLWIEDLGIKIAPEKIKKGPRVGIEYAGPYWAKKHWRFWI